MRDITNEQNNIYELQRYLRELHHADSRLPLVNPDGIYGDETRAAVSEFQRLHGLPESGVTDAETWNRIYAEYMKAASDREPPSKISPFPDDVGYVIKSGERSDTVAIVQFMLRLLADTFDGIEGAPPEGVFSRSTADDIRELQRAYRLPETGEVDKATWNALADAYNRASEIRN